MKNSTDSTKKIGVFAVVDLQYVTLNPCPFCGSRDIKLDDMSRYFSDEFAVFCNNCEALGGKRDYENDAVTAWNNRSNQVGDL